MKDLRTHLDKYGSWALVAGGASGLGYAFCDQLANAGKNLIIVDVDEAALDSASEALSSNYEIEIDSIKMDLSGSLAAVKLIDCIKERRCRLVIYNAAYGPVKPFASNSQKELDLYIDLNCRTLLHLAWHFAKLDHDASAGLLAMSSMAGLRGTQLVAPYAASKAFAWNLMESLYYEFEDTSIDYTAICAGAIATQNFLGTNPQKTALVPSPSTPASVAHEALGILGRSGIQVAGSGNRISNGIMTHILPRKLASKITNSVMGGMYRQHKS